MTLGRPTDGPTVTTGVGPDSVLSDLGTVTKSRPHFRLRSEGSLSRTDPRSRYLRQSGRHLPCATPFPTTGWFPPGPGLRTLVKGWERRDPSGSGQGPRTRTGPVTGCPMKSRNITEERWRRSHRICVPLVLVRDRTRRYAVTGPPGGTLSSSEDLASLSQEQPAEERDLPS